MYRPIPFALWLLTIGLAHAFASGDPEAEVREIERLNVTANWRESDAKIASLAPRFDALSPAQRSRVEFVRLRNLGLAGDQPAALAGLAELLRRDLPTGLRLRIYSTAISIAANVGDWPQAFSWLRDSLSYVSQAPAEASAVLGSASYLYTLVGETGKARDFGKRALLAAESGNDPRAVCLALSDLALAEAHAGNFADSEALRRRQIGACTLAGDPVFIANGKYGIATMAARQGRHAEALGWARQALVEYETAGFEAGAWDAKSVIAESLIESNQDLDRAEALLAEILPHHQRQNSLAYISDTEHLLAKLAERRGNLAEAIVHLKRAEEATAEAERDARERRLAYLQVEFDTKLKEQQIALLEKDKELAALQVASSRRAQQVQVLGMAALVVIAALLGGLLRRSVRERRRYRWLSERDSLTRLYNHQQTHRLGAAAFAAARDAGTPFTAVVADIDLFKQINDTYGHAAGDEVLRALGGWLDEACTGLGLVGRTGGEEFILLLDTGAAGASAVVERLCARIQPVAAFGHAIEFSLSFGLCEADGGVADFEHLLHKADLALYQAKRAGGDRLVASGDQPFRAPAADAAPAGARLVVVGCGIQFTRHVSERCLSEIRHAEVVFCLVDAFALAMIRQMRPDAINLGAHYAPGKDRRQTYRDIDAAIMAEVRAGKHVCAVFYGHPGVFADVPHRVVQKARAEGFPACMEPGISAEACLYADLGLDPGKRGVQSIEATHFMFYDRDIDPRGLVLLWQVALSGDLSCTRFHAEREGLQALVDRLLRWYPPDHEVILYEAASLPVQDYRAERLPLRELPDAQCQEFTTLVIPPLGELSEVPVPVHAAATSTGPASAH